MFIFYFSDHWKLVYSTVAPGFISQPFSSVNPVLPAYKQMPQLWTIIIMKK